MGKWQQSMNDLKFEGKDDVMEKIKSDIHGKESLKDKWSKWMNYELELPLAPLLAFSLAFLLVLSFTFEPLGSSNYSYTITVVNQWGQYEDY